MILHAQAPQMHESLLVNRCALAGLDDAFVAAVRERVRAAALPKAETYFGAATDSSDAGRLTLEAQETARFFDYAPCSASALAALAASVGHPGALHDRALAVVRRLFANAQFFLGEWRARSGGARALRRAHLHLTRAYELLAGSIPAAEAAAWRDLLERSGTDLLAHFNGFAERVATLDNRAFGTGINHVALAAEGVWRSGAVLGHPDWQRAAGEFVDRLVAYCHPDGYFEEHANDAREGGPALHYTSLTAGSAYLVQRWRQQVNREQFARCAALYRQLHDARLRPLAFADERANPPPFTAYGTAMQSLTPEGRGFVRLALDPEHGVVDLQQLSLENLGRLDLELGEVETGSGAVPEPLREGAFRLTLPLGVMRRNGWTMGLSALRALNRDILPRSRWALDRQSLVVLGHDRAGMVLAGAKSKDDPLWSTIRAAPSAIGAGGSVEATVAEAQAADDNAYPVRTGTLRVEDDRLAARVEYRTFAVDASWIAGAAPRLVLAADSPAPLLAQLPLELTHGAHLEIGNSRTIVLDDAPRTYTGVRTVVTATWQIDWRVSRDASGDAHWEADEEVDKEVESAASYRQRGEIRWWASPFDPYTPDNRSAPAARRPVLVVPWQRRIVFRFRTRERVSYPLASPVDGDDQSA